MNGYGRTPNLDTYELNEQRQELLDHKSSLENEGKTLKPECQEKLDELEALASEIIDFEYGAPAIHESNWREYAEQTAEELVPGYAESGGGWPYNCIDWEKAADALMMDYHAVEWQGETYYTRS